jgi:hypothetical protein
MTFQSVHYKITLVYVFWDVNAADKGTYIPWDLWIAYIYMYVPTTSIAWVEIGGGGGHRGTIIQPP